MTWTHEPEEIEQLLYDPDALLKGWTVRQHVSMVIHNPRAIRRVRVVNPGPGGKPWHELQEMIT